MIKSVIIAICWLLFGLDSAKAVSSYDRYVLELHPIGYWELNETSGTTAIDAPGDGYNGTYQSWGDIEGCQSSRSPFVRVAGIGVAVGLTGFRNNSSFVILINSPI